MKKICIFVDGSNLYHSLRNICGRTKIDFDKFASSVCSRISELISEDVTLIRTYYYSAPVNAKQEPEKAKRQQKFFDHLRHLQKFEVNLGRLEPRGNTFIEKDVDIKISVHMLSFARKNIYDISILVSDDGDFYSVLNEVKDMGKMTVYAGFHKTRVLLEQSDYYLNMRDLIDDDLFIE